VITNGEDIKDVDKAVYLRSAEKKNFKIQKEINKRIGKASKFYHLVRGLEWNKVIVKRVF
jgi:hypothetical protein